MFGVLISWYNYIFIFFSWLIGPIVGRSRFRFSPTNYYCYYYFIVSKRNRFGRYKNTFETLPLAIWTVEVAAPQRTAIPRLGQLPPTTWKPCKTSPPSAVTASPPSRAVGNASCRYKAPTRLHNLPTPTNSCKGLIFWIFFYILYLMCFFLFCWLWYYV